MLLLIEWSLVRIQPGEPIKSNTSFRTAFQPKPPCLHRVCKSIAGELMRIPGMGPTIKPEEHYRRLGRIIETAPRLPEPELTDEFMRWVGQANALISALGDLNLTTEAHNAINGLHYPERKTNF